jgi:hypothetical protein
MNPGQFMVLFASLFAVACYPERPDAYMESCAYTACPQGQGLVCVDYGNDRLAPNWLCTMECSTDEDCPVQKCTSYNDISCGGDHGSGLSSCNWCGAEIPGYCRMDCEW